MVNLELKKNCRKVSLHPFSFAGWSLGTVSLVTIGLLLVQCAMLFFTGSIDAVVVLLCALSASVLSELFDIYVLRGNLHLHAWRISVIQGLLTGLLIPSTYPPAGVFLIVFFTMIILRWSLGQFSESWTNSTAVCVIILYFMNSSCFPVSTLSLSDLQTRNAALALIQNGSVSMVGSDSAVTEFLNRTIFKLAGISIPDGYVSLLWDNGSIIPAFRFNLITIVSSLVLVSFDFIEALIPVIFLFVYSILVRFVSPLVLGGVPLQGDIILALFTSGTLFSTLYILQWYGTTPISLWGKIIYGICAGIVAFLIMGFGTSSVGYVFMVLIMNLVSPVMQIMEDKRIFSKIRKRVIPRLKRMKEV